MSNFAPLPLQAVTITHLGDEAALTQTDRSTARPVYAACRSAWISSSRILTWFQLVKVRLTT